MAKEIEVASLHTIAISSIKANLSNTQVAKAPSFPLANSDLPA